MNYVYSAIYKLKPLYEDLEHGGQGWYRLGWWPIYKGTYSFYYSKFKSDKIYYKDDADNGWNRSFKKRHFRIWRFNFWIAYDFLVHKDGPMDVATEDKRPLDLTNIKKALK